MRRSARSCSPTSSGLLSAFNNSGDGVKIEDDDPNIDNADPSGPKEEAYIPYWDTTPKK